MPRPKKESRPFSIRMSIAVYERLSAFCNKTGLQKTVAIEKALEMYIDDYEMKQKLLEDISKK